MWSEEFHFVVKPRPTRAELEGYEVPLTKRVLTLRFPPVWSELSHPPGVLGQSAGWNYAEGSTPRSSTSYRSRARAMASSGVLPHHIWGPYGDSGLSMTGQVHPKKILPLLLDLKHEASI